MNKNVIIQCDAYVLLTNPTSLGISNLERRCNNRVLQQIWLARNEFVFKMTLNLLDQQIFQTCHLVFHVELGKFNNLGFFCNIICFLVAFFTLYNNVVCACEPLPGKCFSPIQFYFKTHPSSSIQRDFEKKQHVAPPSPQRVDVQDDFLFDQQLVDNFFQSLIIQSLLLYIGDPSSTMIDEGAKTSRWHSMACTRCPMFNHGSRYQRGTEGFIIAWCALWDLFLIDLYMLKPAKLWLGGNCVGLVPY